VEFNDLVFSETLSVLLNGVRDDRDAYLAKLIDPRRQPHASPFLKGLKLSDSISSQQP
jgi:hypothetical protein